MLSTRRETKLNPLASVDGAGVSGVLSAGTINKIETISAPLAHGASRFMANGRDLALNGDMARPEIRDSFNCDHCLVGLQAAFSRDVIHNHNNNYVKSCDAVIV